MSKNKKEAQYRWINFGFGADNLYRRSLVDMDTDKVSKK